MSNNLILVFDTETSGLWPKNNESKNPEEYPTIVQLSFIIYDVVNRGIVKEYNTYVKQHSSINFDSEAFKINKITKEMCDKGKNIVDVLKEFHLAYMNVGVVIAHNLWFDKRMIEIEILRNYEKLPKKTISDPWVLFNDTFNELWGLKTYCTMNSGKDKCNIIMKDKRTGNTWKKSPKLSELYEKLFNEKPPEGLHNSQIDTMICLQCYLKMVHNYDKN